MYDFQIVEDLNIANKILAGNLNRVRPWKGYSFYKIMLKRGIHSK